MSASDHIIADLELLNSQNKLNLKEIADLEKKIVYNPISHYLQSLKQGSKPESASADLMKKLVEDFLGKTGFSEVKIKEGFIDFAIQEIKVNPILIELKPAFDRSYDKHRTMDG